LAYWCIRISGAHVGAEGDAGLAAQDEGVLVGVPVGGGALDRRTAVRPRLEAAALAGERAERLPPGLDQVAVGSVRGLVDELLGGVAGGEERDVGGVMRAQVVQDQVDGGVAVAEPAVDRGQEVDEIGGRPAVVGPRECVAGGGPERPEAVAAAAPPVVDRLRRAGCGGGGGGRAAQALAAITLGALQPQRIHADDGAAGGQVDVARCYRPLLAAKSGSTRAPNQVSCARQRSPSAASTSWIRLRLIAMHATSLRYALSRSYVQSTNGRPWACGSVSVATTAPTCSDMYVAGRPTRGASAGPSSPSASKRRSHRRTVSAPRPTSAGLDGHPPAPRRQPHDPGTIHQPRGGGSAVRQLLERRGLLGAQSRTANRFGMRSPSP